jgi:lycopene cyclase domain-containing protein
MTYFGFLARFLLPPLVALGLLHALDRRRGRRLPANLRARNPWTVIGALVVVALVYTTPWDNYLVASGTWWYDPDLVAVDWVIGWVPLEEYCFFVLQTVMTGMLWLWLARRLEVDRSATTLRPATAGGGEPSVPVPASQDRRALALRRAGVLLLAAPWLWAVAVIVSGWLPGRYLALELAWALPPIAFQVGFGVDILWRRRRSVLAAIGVATLYLAAADLLAIRAGTWTISPEQTLGWLLPGGLPLEEGVFFLITNVLVVFGLTLVVARESQERVAGWPWLGPRLAAVEPDSGTGPTAAPGRAPRDASSEG